jgi:hypothetical protein
MVNGGGNRLMFKGALPFIEAACGGPPFHHYRGPPPPDKQGEASLEVKKQEFERTASRHYAYLPTPAVGVGGERSETEGGGCHAAAWI